MYVCVHIIYTNYTILYSHLFSISSLFQYTSIIIVQYWSMIVQSSLFNIHQSFWSLLNSYKILIDLVAWKTRNPMALGAVELPTLLEMSSSFWSIVQHGNLVQFSRNYWAKIQDDLRRSSFFLGPFDLRFPYPERNLLGPNRIYKNNYNMRTLNSRPFQSDFSRWYNNLHFLLPGNILYIELLGNSIGQCVG